MKKEINLNKSVYDLVTQFPEIKEIMVSIGFDNITKPGMLQTAGRVMTLPKGCRMKEIPLEKVIEEFEKHGFTVYQ
ncbi:DUF1858 domain-containing protein [Evansella cellulosilytica]|uniref:DUF1858 domain-containing protein n=1 Tax=Evansella cellulosilytica (strain ATCC 21833 / DSM 2522 / FERM P-1141 / JCM 9156 / N-4) TaxID=649639 RepID=E6TV36_EVAC2|nr:DUF1858 domain-containing protein [Evansella cellulosilytica]ADU28619.1 Domain of unknown function DUF1858 [Evansella cellulosilytica DSM 2522]